MPNSVPQPATTGVGGLLLDLIKQLSGQGEQKAPEGAAQEKPMSPEEQQSSQIPGQLQHVIIVQPPAQAATAKSGKTPASGTGEGAVAAPQAQAPQQTQQQAPVVQQPQVSAAPGQPLQAPITGVPQLSTLAVNMPAGPDAQALSMAMNEKGVKDNQAKAAKSKSGGENLMDFIGGSGDGGGAGKAVSAISKLAGFL